MTIYKIKINNRNYIDYNYYDSNGQVNIDINPVENKLFNEDTFYINKNKTITIVNSPIKTFNEIPGVLILNNNKSFGRIKNKLLYKCIPNDKTLPSFLIPYEIKHVGFSKVLNNLYILFSFEEWSGKHPQGILKNVLGNVNDLNIFYEYQLYCKNLNNSINNFTKKTNEALVINNLFDLDLEKRTNIYTIDPDGSLDYDDGFSIIQTDNIIKLSIYISNVSIVLDKLNLWSYFTNRISTIYLPNKKKSMLPPILSDDLCSLKENTDRYAFTMDIFINDKEIIEIKYSNCLINVTKNYFYEEESLLNNSDYILLLDTVRKLSVNPINDSHDAVAYLMILMNYHCSRKMSEFKNGIYRVTSFKESDSNLDLLPDSIKTTVKTWLSNSGKYIEHTNNLTHNILNLESYLHITSPIRRIVDLLNMIKLQENLNMINLSNDSKIFYNSWINKIDFINDTFKAINKVQRDCSMLDLFTNLKNKIFDGYIINKETINKYNVYLPELKLFSTINSLNEIITFEKKLFKLFLFHDENQLKQKIKLQLCE